MKWLTLLWILVLTCYNTINIVKSHDRIPPGIAPQHYQPQMHQPNQQHHGGTPQGVPPLQHQQQQQQQQQQFHQPQHQQQQQFQQVHLDPNSAHPNVQQLNQHNSNSGPHHPHAHQRTGGHHQQQQLLNMANTNQEREHIQEHASVPIDTSKMSEQELQFHYYKMHDYDNNNKLDGSELIKSLIHWHEEGHKDPASGQEEKIFGDDELIHLIEPILQMDDLDKDGYIDYPEFIQAQTKSQQQPPPSGQR